MTICIPTCNRPAMAARLIEKLPEAILFINNCDFTQYDNIDCNKVFVAISGHPAQCSNDVFCLIIKNAPLGEDLLIIEDDVELCKDFEQELYSRAEAIEAKGIDKYTINPLYTPARMTRYTQHQDFRTSYSKYQFSLIPYVLYPVVSVNSRYVCCITPCRHIPGDYLYFCYLWQVFF